MRVKVLTNMLFDLICLMCLTSAVSAAYAVTAENILSSFRMHGGTQRGGCNRIFDGTLMPEKILTDLNDAFDLVEKTSARIARFTEPSEVKLRLLFRILFGVTFDKHTFQVNVPDGSQDTYNGVKGEYLAASRYPWLMAS